MQNKQAPSPQPPSQESRKTKQQPSFSFVLSTCFSLMSMPCIKLSGSIHALHTVAYHAQAIILT